jgi:dCTP diphosphatase
VSCERWRSAEARRAAPPTLSTGRPRRVPCHARGVSDLIELRDRMRAFTDERAWAKFHDPKSLVLALVGEVGELAELFQWLPADRAAQLAGTDPLHQRVGEEMADVLAYLVRLADVLDIDLAEVTRKKLENSAERFPVAEVRGEAPEKT